MRAEMEYMQRNEKMQPTVIGGDRNPTACIASGCRDLQNAVGTRLREVVNVRSRAANAE